jgi:flagellar biosynthetic protein FliR
VLVLFSLVLARTFGLFMGAPVFSGRGLPRRFRVALAVIVSVALLPAAAGRPLPDGAYSVGGAMVYEGILGLGIWLIVRMMLTAFQIAGGLISFQAGFAMAAAFDPISGTRSTVIQTLHLHLVTMLFLLVDGHHLLLRSLAASYEVIPAASGAVIADLTRTLFVTGTAMFEMGARIAGPVTGLLLLVNAVVGFLNRIMPQLSIFNIGFPMQVCMGLVALFLSVPEVAEGFFRAMGQIEQTLAAFLEG